MDRRDRQDSEELGDWNKRANWRAPDIIGTTLGCGFRSYNPSGGSRIAADSIAVNQRTREARGSTGDPRSARGRRADSTRTTEIVACNNSLICLQLRALWLVVSL